MGITGLLPFLKEVQREVNVSSFRGRKAAVDAYCWLHKGAYSCAMQLVMKSEKLESLPFIRYCMKRVNMLRQNDITPIMVFDGGYLPTKANTEKERRERRQSYLTKGKELLKVGKRSEAVDCFQKSVDVSHEMALALIKECRRIGVECIVAPYEADAQLAYLEKEGIVDVVITEDSDLLVFGCKRVLFKMDDAGNGKLIDLMRDNLGKANKSLIGFTQDSFRQMCIFSGCDYLASVPGIGLGKAMKLMRKYGQNPQRAIRGLRVENNQVPKDYEVNFKKAEWTFLYQLVFDPRTQQQVRLHPIPDDIDPTELEFAGIELQSPRKVVHLARGNIDPISLKILDDYSPAKAPPPSKSQSWVGSVMGTLTRQQYPLSIQAKLPLISTTRSKGQFKPPKRTLPQEETDNSMADDELRSIYEECGSSMCTSGGTSSTNQMSSDSWLSKRRRLETSGANLTSSLETKVISQYFAPAFSRGERAEQTPDGETNVMATKTARKLLLKNETHSLERQGEFVSSAFSSSSSPNLSPDHRSTLQKSDSPLAECSLVSGESTARKQLFTADKGSASPLFNKFKYSGSKKLMTQLRGQSSPFELLDRSQEFISEIDSENKCFLLTKTTAEEDHFNSERSSVISQVDKPEAMTLVQKEDMPSLQTDSNILEIPSSDEDSSCSFSYMTSADLITTYSDIQEKKFKPTLSQETSCSVTEQILLPSKSRTSELTVPLAEKSLLNTHRASYAASTNSSKVATSRRESKQRQLGLPRKSTKFNPPKSVDALKQTTLFSSLSYTRRPQM